MNTRLKDEKDKKWLKPRKQLMYVTIVVRSFPVGKGNAQAQGAQGPGAKLFHRHGRSLESSTHAPPG